MLHFLDYHSEQQQELGSGKMKKAQPKYHLILEELELAPSVDVGVPTYGCEIPE